jgi:NACHT domain
MRFRISPWAVGLLATGVMLLLGGRMLGEVGSSNPALAPFAKLITTCGGVLASFVAIWATVVGPIYRWHRGAEQPHDPAEVLAWRVWRAERETHRALLGTAVPANLAFDQDPGPQQESPHPILARLLSLVHYQDEHSMQDGDLNSIDEFYRSLPVRRMIVLGPPGSGKTVLAVELILRLVQPHIIGRASTGDPVPVRFSLASWDTNHRFDDWLTERIKVDYGLLPAPARQLVDERRILPVLDGLDEMDPDSDKGQNLSSKRALAALRQLDDYLFQVPQGGGAVVTCRASRYEELLRLGGGFVTLDASSSGISLLPRSALT